MCFKHAKENRVAPHQLCIPVLPRLFVFLGLRKAWEKQCLGPKQWLHSRWLASIPRSVDTASLVWRNKQTNKQPLRIPTVKSQNLSFYAQPCSVPFLWEDLDVPKSLGTLWMGLVVPQPGIPAAGPGAGVLVAGLGHSAHHQRGHPGKQNQNVSLSSPAGD